MSDEDNEIWDEFIKDIDSLRDKKAKKQPKNAKEYENFEKLLQETDKSPSFRDSKPQNNQKPDISSPKDAKPAKKAEKAPKARFNAPIDRAFEDRLRKGQIAIEATLDLHGLNAQQAEMALYDFIRRAKASAKQNLLVITGKGRSGSGLQNWLLPRAGILKRSLPEWLGAPDIAPHIKRFVPAHKRDGGSGAFYVILRKK